MSVESSRRWGRLKVTFGISGQATGAKAPVADEERLPRGTEKDLGPFDFVDLHLVCRVHDHCRTILEVALG